MTGPSVESVVYSQPTETANPQRLWAGAGGLSGSGPT